MNFKPLKYILATGITVVGLSVFVNAEKIDYVKEASKYQKLCSTKSSFKANKKACSGYEDYLNSLKKKSKDAQNIIKQNIKDNKNDIQKTLEVIKSNNSLIETTDKQIKLTELSIANHRKEIKRLETDFLERLALTQQVNSENLIVDFLTQSLSLNDFFTRLDGINAINNSNREVSSDLEDQKVKLEQAEKELVANKDVLKEAKASNEILLKKYYSNEAQLYNKLDSERIKNESYNKDLDTLNLADLESSLNNEDSQPTPKPSPSKPSPSKPETSKPSTSKPETSKPETSKPSTSKPETSKPETSKPSTSKPETSKPAPSTKLSIPVKSATVTATSWYYPASFGGGWHPGIDLANNSGTKVYSPAKGVELTRGFEAYGYGNYLVTAHQIGKDTYTLIYGHLKSYAAKSTTLDNGTLLAYMGSTGNSTGPHTHVEILKHTNKSLSQVVNTFKQNRDISFGVGYNGTKNGNVQRLKPHEYWGLKYYQRY